MTALSKSDLVILGDANLDANKWREPKFDHAHVAEILVNSLEQNGIQIHNQETKSVLKIKQRNTFQE